MLPSEVYYKRAKEAIRAHQDRGEEAVAEAIHEVLCDSLHGLPDSLQHDIFNFYYEEYQADPREDKNLYELAEAPCALMDFLTGDGGEPDFSDEEWSMVREGINACADTMDLETLNRLMAVLVEKKQY